ncbi:MAG TPA: glycosyltransferase [Mycobacteriales bacterium]|jgi:tetratricopeptide (TPR) repeat protein|nr:glycosyltransferase [Mycobacteriales bacterium]
MSEPTLSVAMIVKDEASKLAGVLADARGFCDELIVVDTGSTDATVEIALAAGAAVHEFAWIDDFAAARNVAFDHCTSDWIMWLDADDRVPADVQTAIRALKPTLTETIDAVFAEYRLYDTNGVNVALRYDRERLIRRAAGLRWAGEVHEAIAVPLGRSMRAAEVYVEHRPAHAEVASDRNLRILQRVAQAGDRAPRTLFYLANELREHGRHDEAVAAYTDYIAVSEQPWERYSARVNVSICLSALGRHDEALAQAMEAIGEDPSRAEAYNRAALHFYQRESWAQAIPLFLAATAATRPEWGFASEADYSYLPWDYLGVCYYRLGRQHDALRTTARAIELGSPDIERLRANLKFIADLI